MSSFFASERFWIDAMNVGVGLLVMVPLLLVAAVAVREGLRKA